MNPEVVTAPAAEPFLRGEVKTWLGVDIEDYDYMIDDMIVTVREAMEEFLGRALITQTLRYIADNPGSAKAVILPKQPIQSVAKVEYEELTSPGTWTEFVSTTYNIDTQLAELRRAAGWIGDRLRIEYDAGYGDPPDVPRAIKTGMLAHLTTLFENRESYVTGTIVAEIPLAEQRLLRPYRVIFGF